MRCQGLEVGANFVADIAATRGAIGPNDHSIHLAVLHQVTTRIIHNHSMWNPLTRQLIGRERCPLITRTRLIHPNMDVQPCSMGLINRGQRRSPVNRGQPARIAVGEHLKGLVLLCTWSLLSQRLQQIEAMRPNRLTHRHIFISNQRRLPPSRSRSLRFRQWLHHITNPLQSPTQVHSCGSTCVELSKGLVQASIAGVVLKREH